MNYAYMDHAGWVERSTKRTLTDFQKRAVNILGIVGGGIYNAPINVNKIDWNHGSGISVVWKRDLNTFDDNRLTLLVFLCHEARIRCEIDTAGPVGLRISMWQRKDSGELYRRHPNIAEAVEQFRKYIPLDHPLVYENHGKVPVLEEI